MTDMGAYGLGSVRTVQDYIEFSGVDYFNKKASGRALKHVIKEQFKKETKDDKPDQV